MHKLNLLYGLPMPDGREHYTTKDLVTRRAMHAKRYIRARSRNHCCRGKAILHILSVCL